MFYKIVAFALVVLGIFEIVSHQPLPVALDSIDIERSAIGLATVFLGLFNWVYIYETPASQVTKYILLGANTLFIGFAILLINSGLDVIHGYIAIGLSLINSVIVLNHKV